jgi:hypothetical protein
MWSTCSMDTGHSCTHAPHVTQSHTTSSVTAFGTSGVSGSPASAASPSEKSWSRMPMMRSFGDRAFPVANAGHASWQRPHSVQDIASSICFHVRSVTVPAPKRIAASSSDSKSSGSRRPRARVRPKNTLRAAVAMCRCFECGRYARKPRMISTCPQTKTRSSTSVVVLPSKRPESALETGDQSDGHGFRSRAMSVACQRTSVVTIPAMRAKMRSASRRWLPSNLRGRWIFRITKAASTPTRTSVAKTSTRSAYQPWLSSQPSGALLASGSSRSTIAAIAMKIVGKRARKPQKMNACIRPGPTRCRSFRWPRTMVVSLPTRRGRSATRSTGLPDRRSRKRKSARRPNSQPAIAIAPRSATADTTLAVKLRPLSPSSARPRSPGRPRAGLR